MATFGFNRTALRAKQPKLWPPRSFNLTPLEDYLCCANKDKCYADKSETIDALKGNIREAIGEMQLHTINNVVFYFYFPLLTGRIVLSNKRRNLKKYLVDFFKAFSKKKVFYVFYT